MENSAADWKKTFFILWTGQAISMAGSLVAQFAIAWWLTKSTGSSAVLATMTSMVVIPGVVLGPFIGALIDRWDRRRVMLAADSVMALATLIVAVMFFVGKVSASGAPGPIRVQQPLVWMLYILALVRGVAGTFQWIAMAASTSLMVPKEHLTRIGGINQTLGGALNIAAPVLGALAVSLLPMGPLVMIDAVSFAGAILPLFFIEIPQPPAGEVKPAVTPRAVLRDVAEGLRYVWSWPGMFLLIALSALINFCLVPTDTMLPLLVTRRFHGDAWQLSAMGTAWGVGIILGGLGLGVWGGFKRKIVTTLFALLGLGAATLLTGLVPPGLFPLAVACNLLAAAAGSMINGPMFALMQAGVAPEMQGRFFTMMTTISGAITPLGLAVSAPVADAFGVQTLWLIGGVVCLAQGVGGFFIPALMKIEDGPGKRWGGRNSPLSADC